MVAFIGICAGIAALLGPVVFIARWILTPIDRAAKSRQAPARFSIADFLCLFIIIQVPLAAINRVSDFDMRFDLWVMVVAAWIVGFLIWHLGAQTLSKAGVRRNSHRFVYLGLILPLVYYGLLPYTVLSCGGVVAFFEQRQTWAGMGWQVSAWTLLTSLYASSAVFTHWMLNKARPQEVSIDSEASYPELRAG
jgi:hypothetical protein